MPAAHTTRCKKDIDEIYRAASQKGPVYEHEFHRLAELDPEAIANVRWKTGRASSPTVPGRWSSKVIYHRDGTSTVLERQPDGTVTERTA